MKAFCVGELNKRIGDLLSVNKEWLFPMYNKYVLWRMRSRSCDGIPRRLVTSRYPQGSFEKVRQSVFDSDQSSAGSGIVSLVQERGGVELFVGKQ